VVRCGNQPGGGPEAFDSVQSGKQLPSNRLQIPQVSEGEDDLCFVRLIAIDKQILISDFRCSIPQTFIPLVFPNIRLCINHGEEPGFDTDQHTFRELLSGDRVLSVCAYQPVSSQLLFRRVLRTPMRETNQWRRNPGSIISLPCWISDLQVCNEAFFYDNE
jgi:hypothetical protein